jgi:hypothetical protein
VVILTKELLPIDIKTALGLLLRPKATLHMVADIDQIVHVGPIVLGIVRLRIIGHHKTFSNANERIT